MMTTISLNPSVDRTISVDNFVYGGLNRVLDVREDAGGKGINVALAVSQLGLDSECIGFMFKNSAAIFEKKLIANGTVYDFVWCDGSARTNVKVLDRSAGVITELNESGQRVTPEALERMTHMVLEHAENTDFLILSGSLPPQCPVDYYAQLISAVEGLGCRCVLDADGERLKMGVAAKPFLIKPNRYELQLMADRPLPTLQDIRDAAMRYIDMGVAVVAVSLGEDGAMITDGSESLYAPRMDVAVKSTVGAGDSMIAGLVSGFLGENSLEESFRMGVACATAKCMTEGAKVFERATYRALYDMVQIERISACM